MPEVLQLAPEADLHDDAAVKDGRLVLQVQPSWVFKPPVCGCLLSSHTYQHPQLWYPQKKKSSDYSRCRAERPAYQLQR